MNKLTASRAAVAIFSVLAEIRVPKAGSADFFVTLDFETGAALGGAIFLRGMLKVKSKFANDARFFVETKKEFAN